MFLMYDLLPLKRQILHRWPPCSRARTCLPRYQCRTFTGAWEQFWRDVLPAVANVSCGNQCELNPGLVDTGLLLYHSACGQGGQSHHQSSHLQFLILATSSSVIYSKQQPWLSSAGLYLLKLGLIHAVSCVKTPVEYHDTIPMLA